MQIKEVRPINFLLFRTEATVNELHEFVGNVSKALHLEAAKLGLDVTGPVYWNYYGFNGQAEKPFRLEIGIPIGEMLSHYEGPYEFQRCNTFKCLSSVHEGSWENLPKTYEKMMHYIVHHQLRPTVVSRELYINSDFRNPEANVTEVQIGIE